MITKQQVIDKAKEAKELRIQTSNGWVYIKLEKGNLVVVPSSQFHDEIDFEYIAAFTPDAVLKDDYGIYRGAELTISKLVDWVNEDYFVNVKLEGKVS